MKPYQETGLKSLQCVLKSTKNIQTFEKYIMLAAKSEYKYNNIEHIQDIYLRIVYQVIGDIINIKNNKNLKQILKQIKKHRVYWKHKMFDDIKSMLNEHDEFIVSPFEVEEGVTECKCGSKRVYTFQIQQRSCDEPMSTHAQCLKCKSKWVYSG
jgi:DNA-directed RNA polymerase subunit M/transcription elongation factor TFIIS